MNGVVKQNKLGTFSPPLAVFPDKAFPSTLHRRHLSNVAVPDARQHSTTPGGSSLTHEPRVCI